MKRERDGTCRTGHTTEEEAMTEHFKGTAMASPSMLDLQWKDIERVRAQAVEELAAARAIELADGSGRYALEAGCNMVAAAGFSTGHADNWLDLLKEVLDQAKELRIMNQRIEQLEQQLAAERARK